MAETVAGGSYLAADGKTLVNAHGDVIDVEPEKKPAAKAEKK